MASAASSSRKRKSSSASELDNGSSTRKKMKDAVKIGSQSSSQSKRTKPKSKKDIKAGLKTVSELAKLVTSGAVQVPKSLLNYASDKALLLDQVFTILSPTDVNEMLPDILKGLRMKRIKNLCYEQLQEMSVDEIKRALQPEDTLPAAVSSTQVEVTSSASNQMQPTMSVSKTSDVIVEKTCIKEMNKATEVVPTQSHRVDDNNRTKDSLIEDKRGQSPPQAQSGEEEIVVHVSDVSGEEEGDDDSREAGSMKKRGAKRDDASKASPVLKEEYIVTSLKLAQQSKCLEEKLVENSEEALMLEQKNTAKSVVVYEVLRSDDTHASSESEVEEDAIHNVVNEELKSDEVDVHTESGSSVEEYGMDDLDADVSELDATQLLEMEMRRRALESELKKFSDSKPTAKMKIPTSPQNSCTSPSDEDCAIEVYVSDSEALDCDSQAGSIDMKQSSPLNKHEKGEPQAHVGPSEVQVETDTMDIGQLLEMKLRQKALQSLLKKRQNSTQ